MLGLNPRRASLKVGSEPKEALTADKSEGGSVRLLVSISSTTSTVFPVFITGAVAVQLRHSLHFSIAFVGVAVAIFFGTAAITSLFAGSLAERHGGAKVMRMATFASAVMMGLIALVAHSFGALAILLALAGIANGTNQPANNLFVINAVKANKRGFALGVKQAAIPVATLLAGLAVPSVALTIGWRYVYVFAAIIAVVVSLLIPSDPDELKVKVQRRRDGEKVQISLLPVTTLAVAMALGAGTSNALGAYLVEFAVHQSYAPGSAGLIGALGSLVSLVTRLSVGYRADKRDGKHLLVVASMIGTGAIGYLLFASSVKWLVIPAAVIGYGFGWGWNGLFNFAVVVNHKGAEGRATGITQSGAFVGSVAGPISFGYSVVHLGFQTSWVLLVAVAVASSLLMLFGRHLILLSRNQLNSNELG
ncbi:MAG: MFS transporter [Actinomycetota bacterium]|nr:MFS transporter [Actinomycetota bacterium]